MIQSPEHAGVSAEDWRDATASCHALRVAAIVEETHDSRSIVLEIPDALAETFRYRAGQFLSFKTPFEGVVLTRSYSLASSPDTEREHKVTVKRVDEGRISNLYNDALEVGDTLTVVPPAGLFVLGDGDADLCLFAGGSGITPVISLIKSALATTRRSCRLVYANRDERSIIFREELDELARRHPGRLEVHHSLDDRDGFLDAERVRGLVAGLGGREFYICGPAVFMDVVEAALAAEGVAGERIHVERFVSPPDPGVRPAAAAEAPGAAAAPGAITVLLDGEQHEIPYEPDQGVLAAARKAGLDPPFSCEEGYCSCCMARLVEGTAEMPVNDCLTEDLLEEGWILTCQARCTGSKVRVEYPD